MIKSLATTCMLLALLIGAPACDSGTAESKPTVVKPKKDPGPLSVGDPAPLIKLTLHDGEEVALASLDGSYVLVYFYPKDDTPGCTTQAEGLRDRYDELKKLGVHVFGVSTQGAKSHKAFIKEYDLPFRLVVDEDGRIAKSFNVPVRLGFAARQSFLIGKDGKFLKIWRNVVPGTHASRVLQAVRLAEQT